MKVSVEKQMQMWLRHRNRLAHPNSSRYVRQGLLQCAVAYAFLHECKSIGESQRKSIRTALMAGMNFGRKLKDTGRVDLLYTHWYLPRNCISLFVISKLAAYSRSLLKKKTIMSKHAIVEPYILDIGANTFEIMSWFTKVEKHANPCYMLSVMRPLIYWDLQVNGNKFLGRIIFELCTECAPDLVWEFVRSSALDESGAYKFLKINNYDGLIGEKSYPMKLQEDFGSMAMGLVGDPDLSHGEWEGVLSVCKRTLNRFDCGVLKFAVSFCRNAALDEHTYPIGRIVEGKLLMAKLITMQPITALKVIKCGWKM